MPAMLDRPVAHRRDPKRPAIANAPAAKTKTVPVAARASDAPKKRRKKSPEERRDEILTAAFEVFGRDGFQAAKVDDIAALADVSKGTIYVYYETKERIFEDMVRRYIVPAIDEIEMAAVGQATSAEDALRAALRVAYRRLAGDDVRRVVVMLMGEGDRFPALIDFYYTEVMARAAELIGSIIERGVEAGEFRDVPARAFPQMIVGPGVMGAIWKHHFDRLSPLDLDDLRDAHVELLLAGLRPAGKPKRSRRAPKM